MNSHRKKRSEAKKGTPQEIIAKPMVNIIYGEGIGNLKNIHRHDVVKNDGKAAKVTKESKNRHSEFQIPSDDLVQVIYPQTRVLLNRPVYVGACVLDLSKL